MPAQKRKTIILIVVIIVAILGAITGILVQSGRKQAIGAYGITKYKGHLTIHEDNSAVFRQVLSYQYNDSFNGQYVSLGTAGDMPQGFRIQSDDIQYRVYRNGLLVSSSYPGELAVPRPVSVENMGDGYRLKIYNAVGEGDTVRIEVDWPLQNILFPYQDIAELNWVPISDWDVALHNVEIQVTAPEYQESQLAVHTGYLREAAQIDKKGADYVLKLDYLGRGKKLELHGYWNSDILSAVSKEQMIPQNRLSHYQATEANIQKYSQWVERITYFIFPLVSVLVILLDGLRWYFFKKHVDLRTKMLKNGRLYESPSDLNPMLVARSIYNIDFDKINPAQGGAPLIDFDHVAQATILDLIDRGNLAIEEKAEQPVLTLLTNKGLAESEAIFLDMAFAGHMTLEMDQLFSDFSAENHFLKTRTKSQQTAIRRSGESLIQRYNKAFKDLRQAVEDDHNQLRLPAYYRNLDAAEKRKWTGIGLPSLLVGIAGLLFYLYLLLQFSTQSWILLLVLVVMLGSIVFIYASKSELSRQGILTEAGLEQYHLWESFKNMLRDIGKFDKTEIDAVMLWNRILVYATLFGYAKEVSRVLKIHDIQLENPSLNAYVYRGYSPFLSSRTGSFNQDVRTAREASNFNVSSGSSGGGFSSGGFSGGGGGGGGGSF
ncbi:DUF2207 domain-containing protein [Streptococcus moroccensis]|uniref:Membrane protein YgcG n=1 Tax=Streptococcus moroccensis TaxID=1451356 RepID=A0ABT9YQ98_9STRE|nr:DUF2207 domain-containing protein [Streptococcus moroccensis]MDQ0221899.1 putative membrane protein YgcG [Streptococcus moroccensis]